MGLFDRVQLLGPDCHKQVFQFYETSEHKFPIEIRNLFAQDIENATCGFGSTCETVDTGFDPRNPTHYPQITEFLSTLISSLESRLNGEDLPFFIKHKLSEALGDLKESNTTDPLGLFKRIRACIAFEISLVKKAEESFSYSMAAEKDIIMENLGIVRKRITNTGELLKAMVAEQEQFALNCNEKQKLDDTMKQLQDLQNPSKEAIEYGTNIQCQIQQMEMNIQQNIQQLLKFMALFQDSAVANIKDLSELQANVFQDKLLIWRHQQQLAANGVKHQNPINLEKLQAWCEELADLIWLSRQQLKEAERLQNQTAIFSAEAAGIAGTAPNTNSVPTLLEYLTRLLAELLNGCFLVENQPPQVMKLGTRFPSALTVSLLVGGRLNVQMTSPAVSTRIINEAQAKHLSTSDVIEDGGEIVNGNTKFDFNKDAKRLMANFRSIQLKKIKRADRRGSSAGNECVMEEKFCLLFESSVNVGELKIRVRVLSLPVVVISHGSQEPLAVATIMWDNAFGEIGRAPFQVPTKVSWAELAPVISVKFEQTVGKGLSEEHLRVLKQKAFGNRSHSEFISWSEFCKDHLLDRQFSFWDWLFHAMRTIEKKETHLKEIWKEDLIMGFIDRQSVETILSLREPGTFLLRFSDSLLGAITIAWVNDDGRVYLVNPFTLNDLANTRLADSIKGIEKLQFLYPDIPRDMAFGKFYSKEKPTVANKWLIYVDFIRSLPSIGDTTPGATPNRRTSGTCSPHPGLNWGSPSSNPGMSPLDQDIYRYTQGMMDSNATSTAISDFQIPDPFTSVSPACTETVSPQIIPDFSVLQRAPAHPVPSSSPGMIFSHPMQMVTTPTSPNLADVEAMIISEQMEGIESMGRRGSQPDWTGQATI